MSLYLFSPTSKVKTAQILQLKNVNCSTLSKWGSMAFAVAAPSTWNSVPVHLRTAGTVTLLKKTENFSFRSDSPPPPKNSSEIRRPVEDLSFAC